MISNLWEKSSIPPMPGAVGVSVFRGGLGTRVSDPGGKEGLRGGGVNVDLMGRRVWVTLSETPSEPLSLDLKLRSDLKLKIRDDGSK